MKKILLAIDGSACSTSAVDLVNQLPLAPNCHITVLTVLEEVAALLLDAGMDDDIHREYIDIAQLEKIEAQRKHDAVQLLETTARRLQRPDRSIDTTVRHDDVANGIVEAAGELAADLVVVGSHGSGAIKRFLIGSVSRKVVDHAPCSVLVVRQTDESVVVPPLRVVVALDGSVTADAALSAVAQMAGCGPLRVTVVRVLASSRFYRMDILERLTRSWEKQKQVAQDQLAAAGEVLRQAGAEVSLQLRDGHDVTEEILGVADQDGADIIVLGHKGQSGINRFHLGSVSRRVVSHASCSVWVYRDR